MASSGLEPTRARLAVVLAALGCAAAPALALAQEAGRLDGLRDSIDDTARAAGAAERDVPAADRRSPDRPAADAPTSETREVPRPETEDAPTLDARVERARGPGDGDDDGDDEEEEDAATDPFAPPGFRVGTFTLLPRIETGVAYSDNVFLTAEDRKSDRAVFVAPTLTFQSNWSAHALSGEFGVRRSYHDRFASEDDRAYAAILRGRLDVTGRTRIESELERSKRQESRDAFGFPADALDRPDIVTTRAALSGGQRFNRLTVTLRGSVAEEDYGDSESRDNTLRQTGARAAYEFRPGVSAFVDWNGNERRFPHSVAEDGTLTGSRGQAAQVGLAFTLGGTLEGEASVGYARQTPEEPTLKPVSGIIFNADLVWRPTALTTVRFSAASTIDETSADAATAFDRTFGVAVEHALRRNLLLGAGVSHGTEIRGDAGVEGDSVTTTWQGVLSAEYLLNPYVGIRGRYVHSRSEGEAAGDGYTENAVTVGVTLRR